MTKDLISIIVPIYNAEKYVKRCVENILQQTYTEFELILINDGSTDGTLEICHNLSWIDKRVHLINRINGGASAARNSGIQRMVGDYVVFIDIDDYVSKNYLENLYLAVISEKYDIVQCNLKYTYENEFNVQKSEVLFKKNDVIEITKIQALNKRKYKVSLCGKIYSKKLFENFQFREGDIYEDDASYYIFVDRAKKIAILNQSLYYYFMSENSVMRNDNKDKSLAFIDIYAERIKYFESRGDRILLEGSYGRYCLVIMLFLISVKASKCNEKDIVHLQFLYKINYKKMIMFKHVSIKDKIIFSAYRVAPNLTGMILKYLRSISIK